MPRPFRLCSMKCGFARSTVQSGPLTSTSRGRIHMPAAAAALAGRITADRAHAWLYAATFIGTRRGPCGFGALTDQRESIYMCIHKYNESLDSSYLINSTTRENLQSNSQHKAHFYRPRTRSTDSWRTLDPLFSRLSCPNASFERYIHKRDIGNWTIVYVLKSGRILSSLTWK